MLEREVKLQFPSPDEARAAIMAAGASPLRPRRLQDDHLFDTGDHRLGSQRSALRLRSEDGRTVLTFKGPVQAGAMKMREEHETTVGDAAVIRHALGALGVHPWFRYQKYREEYQADGVVVAIDETPIGTFVEIEGSEAGILAMTRALGRSEQDFVTESYRTLFVRWREATGRDVRDMVFPGDNT